MSPVLFFFFLHIFGFTAIEGDGQPMTPRSIPVETWILKSGHGFLIFRIQVKVSGMDTFHVCFKHSIEEFGSFFVKLMDIPYLLSKWGPGSWCTLIVCVINGAHLLCFSFLRIKYVGYLLLCRFRWTSFYWVPNNQINGGIPFQSRLAQLHRWQNAYKNYKTHLKIGVGQSKRLQDSGSRRGGFFGRTFFVLTQKLKRWVMRVADDFLAGYTQ